MDYKKLYEIQYGEKKLVNVSQKQFLGLRKVFKKYDWDRYVVTVRLIEPGERILDIGWDGGHIHYFTMEKFCWLFTSQGFCIDKKSGSGFVAKFRNWWPSLLTGDLFIKVRKQY